MYMHIFVHIYSYAQGTFLYFHGFIDIEGQYKDQQLLFKNQTIVKSHQKL